MRLGAGIKYEPQPDDPYHSDLIAEANEKEGEMAKKKQELAPVVAEVPVNKELPQVPPSVVIKYAADAANQLTNIIKNKEHKVVINGKQYLEFGDWQTLGKFFKMGVRTHAAQPVMLDGAAGAKAHADVVNLETGIIIGGAEAYCLRDEEQWKGKPFFQVASMAQTRAGAKALRNALGWVAVLGGYADTPAEEMNGVTTKAEPAPKAQGDLSEVINFGKYKGKSFAEIHKENDSYLPWLLGGDMFKNGKNATLKEKIELFLDEVRIAEGTSEDIEDIQYE